MAVCVLCVVQRTVVTRWTNALKFYWTNHMTRAWDSACLCYLSLDPLFAAECSIAVSFCQFKTADRRYAKQVFGCNKLHGGMIAGLDWPLRGLLACLSDIQNVWPYLRAGNRSVPQHSIPVLNVMWHEPPSKWIMSCTVLGPVLSSALKVEDRQKTVFFIDSVVRTGLRRGVDEICAFLGYYAAYC
jgi:hypothetical protein